MPESAIILPVPEAEPIVGHLRALHDPSAPFGVPAHITLLYPFVPPVRVEAAVDGLRRTMADVPAFDFSLSEFRHFPATAYLHPDPPTRFTELTARLVRQWPEYPPYAGAFGDVVPHLTVADRVAADVLETVARALATALPVRCRATEAWLMCSDERGVWSRREVFRFR